MKEDKLISKSEYAHTQLSGFISVKQYMIYRYQNQKCLLIRFANESNYPFESFEFKLVQLDSKGGIIKEIKSKCERINFAPESMYAMDKGIVIEDRCVDCRIYVTCAISGKYLYRVHGGRKISVSYLTDDNWKYINSKKNKFNLFKGSEYMVARKKEMHPYIWLRITATIAAIALVVLNVLMVVNGIVYGGGSSQNEETGEEARAVSYVSADGVEDSNTNSGEDYVEV